MCPLRTSGVLIASDMPWVNKCVTYRIYSDKMDGGLCKRNFVSYKGVKRAICCRIVCNSLQLCVQWVSVILTGWTGWYRIKNLFHTEAPRYSHAYLPRYHFPKLPQYHLPELRGRRGRRGRQRAQRGVFFFVCRLPTNKKVSSPFGANVSGGRSWSVILSHVCLRILARPGSKTVKLFEGTGCNDTVPERKTVLGTYC